MKKNEKICIGWIDSGTVYSGFVAHISRILLDRSDVISDIAVASGPYLSMNRNSMVDLFLQTDADWLLSLDSDLCITVETFDNLIQDADKDKYPILGGLYYLPFKNASEMYPSAMKLTESGEGMFLNSQECHSSNGIISGLHSVGGGFALIHRSVFEKIQNATGEKLGWFKDEYREETQTWISDDVYFYAMCRALNIKISLQTNTTSQHLKVFKVGEDSYLNFTNSMADKHNHDHNHDHSHNHGPDMMSVAKKSSWWNKKKKVY